MGGGVGRENSGEAKVKAGSTVLNEVLLGLERTKFSQEGITVSLWMRRLTQNVNVRQLFHVTLSKQHSADVNLSVFSSHHLVSLHASCLIQEHC